MAITQSYSHTIVANDFQTNTYETGAQLMPDVLGLSSGGFVSAYNNVDINAGFITLDFYNENFQSAAGYQLAYSNNSDAYYQPKLAELADGNVLVVWDDNNGATSDAGPHASIYTPAGAPVTEDIKLFSTANSPDFRDIDVGVLDDGKFVIGYELDGDIYFRLFNPNGTEVSIGASTQVNTVFAGTQRDTQVTVMNDGAFVVAWTDTNLTDQLIKCRIYEDDGTPRTAEFNLSPGAGDNTQVSLAARSDGGFVAVYTDTGWNEGALGGAGVTLQLVDAAGNLGALTQVTANTAENEIDADVTVLPNGFIVVTWTFPFSPTDPDVYGRIFDPLGTAVTNAFSIAASGLDESRSAVSALAGGGFITSWEDQTTDGDGGSIASQISDVIRTVVGDAAADLVDGDLFRDSVTAGAGDDTVISAGGADTVHGGDGSDSINGGAGNDVLEGGFNADTLIGNLGNDRIFSNTAAAPGDSIIGDSINGGAGKDRVLGAAGNDTVVGGDGDDRVSGGAGGDRLTAGEGEDKLKGQAGDDTLEGGLQKDSLSGGVGDDLLYAASQAVPSGSTVGETLNGGNGSDTLHGADGGDLLLGFGGKDALTGRFGTDSLDGGVGKDRLTGGFGVDQLTGGADRDIFLFLFTSDSGDGTEDTIVDLAADDLVNLSGIDAKADKVGNQAFDLVAAFTSEAGELVVTYHTVGMFAGFTTFEGDVNGDGVADLRIKATGDHSGFTGIVL